MPEKIPQAFFLGTPDRPVVPGDDTWQRPLPLSRRPVPAETESTAGKTVTYGDYFSAVGGFLEKDQYRTIRAVLADTIGSPVEINSVRGLDVFLVKHGEFYHPARVVVASGSGDHSLVINVAVSKAGRDHIKGEFRLLTELYREFEPPVLPRVHDFDEIACGGNKKLRMFSAQWLAGFHEFHLTANPPQNMSNLIVWGRDETKYYLTTKQAEDLYRQAAGILTTAYNFFTFEQVSAWHHAAGDFILTPVDATRVELRLITVRKYAPLIENAEPDPAALVEGLLLFFLNLTIRNRLDRLDGTGALAWADDYAVKGTITGFFNGLTQVVRKLDLPQTFPAEFKNYIQAHSPETLHDLFSAVVDTIPGNSPEHDFIKNRLGKHEALFRTFLGFGEPAI